MRATAGRFASLRLPTCALMLAILSSSNAFSVDQVKTVSHPALAIHPHLPVQSSPLVQKSTVFQLQATSTENDKDDDDNGSFLSSLSFNPIYGFLYVAFLTYGIFLSPGSVGADTDVHLFETFLANPTAPEGWNEIFFAEWNLLGAVPLVLSQLIFPQGSKKGLPATPFRLASVFMGYGALGAYLTLRSPAVDSKTRSEMAWISANILENKIFSWLGVALILSCYVASGVFTADPATTLQGFGNLASQSKLVSVSSVDLWILTIAASVLIYKDYQLRHLNDNDNNNNTKAIAIAASTALFPVFGAALYCALRPSLPEE